MSVFKLFMIAVSISLIITGIFVIRIIRLKNLYMSIKSWKVFSDLKNSDFESGHFSLNFPIFTNHIVKKFLLRN